MRSLESELTVSHVQEYLLSLQGYLINIFHRMATLGQYYDSKGSLNLLLQVR